MSQKDALMTSLITGWKCDNYIFLNSPTYIFEMEKLHVIEN